MNKWQLDKYFKGEKELNKALKELESLKKELEGYREKLLNEPLSFFEKYERSQRLLEQIYSYYTKSFHLNMKDQEKLVGYTKGEQIIEEFSLATSFLTPSLLKGDEKDVLEKLGEEGRKKYGNYVKKVFKEKKHILSECEEKILVSLEKSIADNINTYTALTISDRESVSVEISSGVVEVNSGNYYNLLTTTKNQEDRKKIFRGYFEFYKKHENTIASIYSNVLSTSSKIYKIRGYKDSIEGKLSPLEIPRSVYETLLTGAKKNAGVLKKLIEFRTEKLGLKEYHTYDRFQKIYFSNKKYDYKKGMDIVFEAAKEGSSEYEKYFKEVLQDGLVDVYPSDGKMSGAYSWGIYDVDPFILHNYDESLNSVYTLMHEAGHSMHTKLANKEQEYFNANYPIYLAEIASTFSECLLTDYLLKNERDEKTKKTLLEESILGLVATFYRQSLFADFEYQTHKLVDEGKPLTSEVLSDIMVGLYKDYYNMDIKDEEYKKYVWCFIPHLTQSPLYVYQYATCITASIAIYEEYRKDKKRGLEILFNILKAGGSKAPNEILLDYGIDLSNIKTYDAFSSYLDRQVDELKK